VESFTFGDTCDAITAPPLASFGGMRREDVTREQAAAIKRKIVPTLGYMNRLKARMNRVFAHDNPLFNEVVDAADALHS
jgi:hypothetical protein